MREAKKAGLPVAGHGVSAVGLARQLEAGQAMVAHAEEFFSTVFSPPPAETPTAAPSVSEIPAAVALARRHGAFVVADLVTYRAIARQWGRPAVVEQFLAAPEACLVSPHYRMGWKAAGYARRQGSLDDRLAFLPGFVKALNDGGVPLLSGTDSPDIPGLPAGFALHENLLTLEAAGLSRYQALATATRNAGAFLAATGVDRRAPGTVSPGARADLVLTRANPLDDLRTLSRPLGVMAKGRYYAEDDLRQLLRGVAAAYETPGCPLP